MKFHPGSIRRGAGVGALVAVALTAACDTSSSPTANDGFEPVVGLAVGATDGSALAVVPGVVRVCAFYPNDDVHGPSTFSASATGGDVAAGTFDIEPTPHCFDSWNSVDGALETVTTNLVNDPATLVLNRVVTFVGSGGILGEGNTDATVTETNLGPVTTADVDVSDAIGATLWFKFELTPSGGGQGCTPGYWRQEHHYDSWEGYASTDLFDSVFDDYFPDETLGEVVWARGGGINALGRHAVAALLNASSSDVSYDLTVQQVIDGFNAAAAGDRQAQNAQKDIFEGFNEQGCPLN